MRSEAKLLIAVGVMFILGGLLWEAGSRFGFTPGKLPGDLRIERENMKIYVPITTSLIASAIFSLVAWLLERFGK